MWHFLLLTALFSSVAAQRTYNASNCEPRWVYSNLKCYKQFVYPAVPQMNPSSICTAFKSTMIPENQWKPANSPYAVYAQNQITSNQNTVLCEQPVTDHTRYGTRILATPENSLTCHVRHWHGFKLKNACYRRFRDESMPMSYANARRRCQGFGGDLVFITDLAELEYVSILGHWGHPAVMTDQVAIGGRANGNYDGTTRCARLVADHLISIDNKIISKTYDTIVDFDCQGFVTTYMCKVPFDIMDKRYSFNETDTVVEVTCPPTADRISSTECRCKPGYTDILDTDMPDRNQYQRGQRCIVSNPCTTITQPIDLLFVVDDSGSINATDWTYIVQFLRDGVSVIPRRGNVGFIKFSTWVNGFWLPSGFTDREYLDRVPSIQDGYRTNTPGALDKARDMLREKTSAKKVVVLITDGVPQISGYTDDQADQMTVVAAQNLRNSGARLLVVGIGRYLVGMRNQLLKWVATPSDYFNYAQQISTLTKEHMNNILMTVCQE